MAATAVSWAELWMHRAAWLIILESSFPGRVHMASVMAVVSKKVFEAEAKGHALGSVWTTRRYASVHAALKPLAAGADGGDLYLVTVRPPGEALWLVAVLEAPRFDGEGWSAAPNRAPIADVSSVRGELRFATSTGIQAAAGKLGMSLQTPRTLTESDVRKLREAAGLASGPLPGEPPARKAPSKPAAATRKTPGPAPEKARAPAASLDADTRAALEAANRLAAKTPAQALKAIKALAKKLGATPTATAVLELGADALLDAKKSDQASEALDAWLALATRRKLPLDVARVNRFVRAGAVTPETLGSAWFHADADLVTAVFDGPALPKAPAAFWGAVADPAIARAKRDPAFLARFLRAFEARPAPEMRRIVEEGGGLDLVASRTPAEIHAWLDAVLTWDIARPFDWVERVAAKLAPSLAGSPYDAFEQGRSADLVEALLAGGLPLSRRFVERGLRVRPALTDTATPSPPSAPSAYAGLERVGAEPVFAAMMAADLLACFADTFTKPPTRELLRSLAVPGLEKTWDLLLARVLDVARHGTLADFARYVTAFQALLVPELFAARSEIRALAEALDPARLLASTLGAGLMDEWGWSVLDEAAERLPRELGQYDGDGVFPYWILQAAPRFVVLEPGGVVADLELEVPADATIQSTRWAEGQLLVLYVGAGTDGVWSGRPKRRFKGAMLVTWGNALPSGHGTFTEGGRPLKAGDEVFDVVRGEAPRALHGNGTRAWRVNGEGRVEEFDPASGAGLGPSAPPWFGEIAGTGPWSSDRTLVLDSCSLHPVPPEAASSPLGTKDGLSGFRAWVDVANEAHVEGIDGRRRDGRVDQRVPVGLMTFPERAGFYPVVRGEDGHEVWTPDGARLVFPGLGGAGVRSWRGGPQMLPMAWWHLLTPRDAAGSRALRDATVETARTLLSAVSAAPPADAPVMLSANAVLETPRPGSLPTPPGVAAIRAALPAVTNAWLLRGVAGQVDEAARAGEMIDAWKQAVAAPLVMDDLDDTKASVLASLWGTIPLIKPGELGAQWMAVDAFFRTGDAPTLARPPSSQLGWEPLVAQAGALAFRAAAPATPPAMREQALAVLARWAKTRMAEPNGLQMYTLQRASHLADVDHQRPQALLARDGIRWLIRYDTYDGTTFAYRVLQLSGGPGVTPDGGPLEVSSVLAPREDLLPAALERLVTLTRTRGAFPVSDAVDRSIAAATGLLPATARLLWAGAAGPWELSREDRKALGLTARDLELAAKEIDGRLESLYAEALPSDPASLWSPLEPDASGEAPVDRFARAVVARFGRRAPLPVGLLDQLEASFRDASLPFHVHVRAFEDPSSSAFLHKDARWVVRPWPSFKSGISYMEGWVPPGWPKPVTLPDGVDHPRSEDGFGGWALRALLRYVPWAYLDLPVGDRHRQGIAKIVALLGERLDNPDLLLLAGAVDLSRTEDPDTLARDFASLVAAFEGAPYRSPDDRPAAEGIDRGDLVVTWPEDVKNSIFLAVRPARVKDAEAFAAMARTLGIEEAFRGGGGGCRCGLRFGQHDALDITELDELVAWSAPGFRALVGRLSEPALPAGVYEADPRARVPELLVEVRTRLDLGEDEAALYLMTIALPEPTSARVCRYLDWPRARYTKVGEGLLARKLLVASDVPRTDRRYFVPGPIAELAAPALPLEAHKLPLFGLAPDARGRLRPPFGPVLPLRPLEDLYRDAWASLGR